MKHFSKGFFTGVIALSVFAFILFAAKAFADGPIPGVDSATSFLLSPPALITYVVGILYDLIIRKFPTSNPQGLFHSIAGIAQLIASGGQQIVNLLKAAAEFLDKILGQNLKK